jgi:hypothetical protein
VLEMLVTFDSSAEIQRLVAESSPFLQESKAESLALDAVEHRMAGLGNLFVAPALVKFGPAREAVAAAAAVAEFAAVAGDGGLAPCSVAPILSWHLEDYHLPYQQKPWESCTEECLPSKMFSACPARSFVARGAATLVESFLPLASVCLLPPWHATSSSSILLPLAIGVVELATVPSVDLMVVDLLAAVAVWVEAMSWPPVEASHDEV